VLAFPVAGVLALLYRFPVPFAGYVSGLPGVGYAMVAVLFYGIVGGFPLLAVLGGIVGALATRTAPPGSRFPWGRVIMACMLPDVAALSLLAVLDKIIGPW
jgi:hypothetical protein